MHAKFWVAALLFALIPTTALQAKPPRAKPPKPDAPSIDAAPANASDDFAIETLAIDDSDNVVLRWHSVAGQVHRVYRSSTLEPGQAATTTIAPSVSGIVVSFDGVANGRLAGVTIRPQPDSVAIRLLDTHVTVRNCVLTGGYSGVGINYTGSVRIVNCAIVDNAGYGIWAGGTAAVEVVNCTIADNAVRGTYLGGSTAVVLTNTILYGNADDIKVGASTPITVAYCNIGDGDFEDTNGNISFNPLFVAPGAVDYRLRPGSPCIDAGTSDGAPSADLFGWLRRDIGAVPNTGSGASPWYDIGAYEYAFDCDVDGDLDIDADDLAQVYAGLGGTNPALDIDGDGHVTFADLRLVRDHIPNGEGGLDGGPALPTVAPTAPTTRGAERPGPQENQSLVDTDGDGMPDDWETANGLDPTDPRDGTQDADGDWLLSEEEFRFGSEPGNASSPEFIYVDDDAAGNALQDGTPEHPYEAIQAAIDAAAAPAVVKVLPGKYVEHITMADWVWVIGSGEVPAPTWKPVYGPVTGTGSTMEYRGPAGEGPEFYRVSVEAQPDYWPNELSNANSDDWLKDNNRRIQVMRPKVLVLHFINDRGMNGEQKANDLITALEWSSRYRYFKNPDSKVFMNYEAKHVDLRDPPGTATLDGNSTKYPRRLPAGSGPNFMYAHLYNDQFAEYYGYEDPDNPGQYLALAELMDRGLVHEVWFSAVQSSQYGSPYEAIELKQMYDENLEKIPGYFAQVGNGNPDGYSYMPRTGRSLRVNYINGQRGIGCSMENLAHSIERMSLNVWSPWFTQHCREFLGANLDTKWGVPFHSFYKYSYNYSHPDYNNFPDPDTLEWTWQGQSGVVENYVATAGNAHFMPNGRWQYDRQNTQPVMSKIEHMFMRDGPGGEDMVEEWNRNKWTPYNNIAPDCMGPWLVFWRQAMPGLNNTCTDDNGDPMLNWWVLLFY